MSKQSVVLILGAHRSGTSCLATCLEECGVQFVDLNRSRHKNNTCRFRPDAVRKLHDRVLSTNGATWFAPPDKIFISRCDRSRLTRIAEWLLSERHPVGMKDPGLLLLPNIWHSLLGSKGKLGTFRHPSAMIESLIGRNGATEKQLLRLWLRCNRELIRQHRIHRFPLVEYDLECPVNYVQCVAQAAIRIGISVNENSMLKFGERSLRRHPANPQSIPVECKDIYSYLQENAERPGVTPHRVEPPVWLRPSDQIARNTFLQAIHMPPNVEFAAE